MQRHRQREKQAPCGKPDAGLDPLILGSHPEPKADAQLLSHPGAPYLYILFVIKCPLKLLAPFCCCWAVYLFFFFLSFICLFMRDTQRREAEKEAGSMQRARCRTQSQDSRITPWAKGRRSTTEPPRRPSDASSKLFSIQSPSRLVG